MANPEPDAAASEPLLEPWWPLQWKHMPAYSIAQVTFPDGSFAVVSHYHNLQPSYRMFTDAGFDGCASDLLQMRCVLLTHAYPGSKSDGDET